MRQLSLDYKSNMRHPLEVDNDALVLPLKFPLCSCQSAVLTSKDENDVVPFQEPEESFFNPFPSS